MSTPVQQWTPYCGVAPAPAEWLDRWNFDPFLLASLLLLAVAWQLRIGRKAPECRAAFAGGIAVLVLLFISPLCALTSALFAARAAHHAVLVGVAAPLLVWSLPWARAPKRFPLAAATAIHVAVLWTGHVPALYAAALGNDAVYWLMQTTLLGSALLFWWTVRLASAPAAVAALLAGMVQMGLLGALITFASKPLYAPHLLSTWPWGLSPIEDQQLAGLIMWAPAAILYMGPALFVAWHWLRDERRLADA